MVEHKGAAGTWTAIEAFEHELREAGPEAVTSLTRFLLHLSPDDAAELERRILAVLEEYVQSDDERLDRPAHAP